MKTAKNDSLGNRMKGYENISRIYLTRRIPVIIRLDGKAFHTLTRGMRKPFDNILMASMQETMKLLCENIQGCVFGYTQSDEITLVLTDYAKITTDAWFGYNIQKMASIAASMATVFFNKSFIDLVDAAAYAGGFFESDEEYSKYQVKAFKAMFDARVFTIPKDEVCNCLIWRQQDATRNSIESVGQAYFSANQLYKKSCNAIQDMLWRYKGVNWNDYPTDCKRGAACYRINLEETITNPLDPSEEITVSRRRWVIDKQIPIFTQDRSFVERWL